MDMKRLPTTTTSRQNFDTIYVKRWLVKYVKKNGEVRADDEKLISEFNMKFPNRNPKYLRLMLAETAKSGGLKRRRICGESRCGVNNNLNRWVYGYSVNDAN